VVTTRRGPRLEGSIASCGRSKSRDRKLDGVTHLLTTIGDTANGKRRRARLHALRGESPFEARKKYSDEFHSWRRTQGIPRRLPDLRAAFHRQRHLPLSQGGAGELSVNYAVQRPDLEARPDLPSGYLEDADLSRLSSTIDTATAQGKRSFASQNRRAKPADLGVRSERHRLRRCAAASR